MEGIQIKKLGYQDTDQFLALVRVFEDVFEMKNFTMPPREYLQTLLNSDLFFVFVALSGDRVVAGLTAYALQQYYSQQPVVYIYDLAVKREMQRQGIGSFLISVLNAYCKEAGIQEVFVQADVADSYALDFYRSTGASPEDVVHFTYLF